MNNTIPKCLKTLWSLTGSSDSIDSDNNWNTYFGEIGLILVTPQVDFDRECLIPINSLTFATTGGGSVHYGLIAIKGAYSDASPVVMTVPNCDKAHLIIGENLKEFIGLGIRTGYSVMEDIAYSNFDATDFEKSLHPYKQNGYIEIG